MALSDVPVHDCSMTRRPSQHGVKSCGGCHSQCCGCCASRPTESRASGPRQPPGVLTPTASSSQMWRQSPSTSAAAALQTSSWTLLCVMHTLLVRMYSHLPTLRSLNKLRPFKPRICLTHPLGSLRARLLHTERLVVEGLDCSSTKSIRKSHAQCPLPLLYLGYVLAKLKDAKAAVTGHILSSSSKEPSRLCACPADLTLLSVLQVAMSCGVAAQWSRSHWSGWRHAWQHPSAMPQALAMRWWCHHSRSMR